ncbi:hypothetical protein HPB51_005564 [Rhipicephalus microplus]|uniref:Myosin motor domain-containing protein n=1 Tax=Rhipicephalus microplus TaxID=6941 RepID=A0A9J6EXV9_RHIMP|nr:hypothetical protein HPB51_005564 [Rhipicephalus microplus]
MTAGTAPLPVEEEGKVRVRLDATGEVVLVDEDDVEKANPPELDFVEDLGQLRQLNEAGMVHVLRERFASGLVHTYAGSGLLLFNPQRPLAIYSDKVVHFHEVKAGFETVELTETSEDKDDESIGDAAVPGLQGRRPATARVCGGPECALGLVATRRDQTVLFLGRSGSGQSAAARQVLQYLSITTAPTPTAGNALAEKLTAAAALLESFGNSRTAANANASRFTQLFSLDFDHMGQVVAASVQKLRGYLFQLAKEDACHDYTKSAGGKATELSHQYGILYRKSLRDIFGKRGLHVEVSEQQTERPVEMIDNCRQLATKEILGLHTEWREKLDKTKSHFDE